MSKKLDELHQLFREWDKIKEEEYKNRPAPSCEHPNIIVKFDLEKANRMSQEEVHKEYPAFWGKCPDCDFEGKMYASLEHYLYLDG